MKNGKSIYKFSNKVCFYISYICIPVDYFWVGNIRIIEWPFFALGVSHLFNAIKVIQRGNAALSLE